MGTKLMRIWNFISDARTLLVVCFVMIYIMSLKLTTEMFYNPYIDYVPYALFFGLGFFMLVHLTATLEFSNSNNSGG